MTETGNSSGERFQVVCIEENSIDPKLANFRHKVVYQAARYQEESPLAYRVWFGPSEEQSETFDGGAFNRYFEEELPVIRVDATTDIKDDILLKLHRYMLRDIARGDRLEQLHEPIELAIRRCRAEIDRARATVDEFEKPWVDEIVNRECDQIEELLGVAFGATQVVLTAFRTRFVRLLRYCQEDLGKNVAVDSGNGGRELFKNAPELRSGCGFTVIQAINEVANYWKHKDEWTVSHEQAEGSTVSIWLAKTNQRTVNTVMVLGMQPSSTGNLRKATELLGVKRYEDLRPIRSKVEKWMKDLLSMVERELGIRSDELSP